MFQTELKTVILKKNAFVVNVDWGFLSNRLPRGQEILGKKCGFKKINTIGLFFGSTRIAFKLGKKFGNFYYGFLSKISKQRITKYFYEAF